MNRFARSLDWPLLAIVLLGLLLRLYRLDSQSVWYDELFTWSVAARDWASMMRAVIGDFVHPPLHYALAHLICTIFGGSAVQIRLLSVVCGTLEVAVTGLLASRLLGRASGWLAAFLLAASQLAIRDSQEARPYALASLLSLLAIYCFVVAVQRRHRLAWCGFVAAGCAMLYTHYYTALVLLSLMIFGYRFRRRYPVPFWWWPAGLLFLGLAYVPWLASGILRAALQSAKLFVKGGSPLSLVTSLNWFNNGKWDGFFAQSPLWTFPAGALLFTLPAAAALLLIWRRPWRPQMAPVPRAGLHLCALLWLTPVAVIGCVSIALRMQLEARYFRFALAPYLMLVAYGLQALPHRLRNLHVLLLALYSVAALRANYFIPWKSDYRGAINSIAAHRPEGVCFLSGGFAGPMHAGQAAWAVYRPQLPPLPAVTVEQAMANPAACPILVTVYDQIWTQQPGRPSLTSRLDRLPAFQEVYPLKTTQALYGMDVTFYRRKATVARDKE